MNLNKTKNRLRGFTIVELLITIVIIGILASITIIAYIGMSVKAGEATIISDLDNANKKLEIYKTTNDKYPETITCDGSIVETNLCLKPSSGNTFTYTPLPQTDPINYRLVVSRGNVSYYIDSFDHTATKTDTNTTLASIQAWGGPDGDSGKSITQTNDGGYIISGLTEGFAADADYDTHIFIAKFKSDGIPEWNRLLKSTHTDETPRIIQTNDNKYIVSGNSNYTSFISKYSTDGNLEWSKTQTDFSSSSITKTDDGGYAIAGTSGASGAGGTDAYIMKFSSNDEIQWTKQWGSGSFEYANSITQTTDGSLVMVGRTGGFNSQQNDVFITKFNQNGDFAWAKTWGGSGWDEASNVLKTSDNGLLVVGSANSVDPNASMFISKYNGNGDIIWSKTWGGSNYISARSIIQDKDGGYDVVGKTGLSSLALAKFTNNGDLTWYKTWGDSSWNEGAGIIQMKDLSYVVVGETNKYGAGWRDTLLVRYQYNGSVTGCGQPMCKSTSMTMTGLSANIDNVTGTITNKDVSNEDLSLTSTDISPTLTNVPPENNDPVEETPAQPMTLNFTSQELYVAYPGEDQTTCKEWTAPNGSTIKGLNVSHETESGWDYFTVALDGVEIYNNSGAAVNSFVDTSGTPGVALKACMSADSSYQGGFGGEVTGVIYN